MAKTKTKTKTVKSLAYELSRAFERRKRNDGEEFSVLKADSPTWMTEVSHAVHGDKLPDDTVYAFIERCADAIADYGDETADPSEAIGEIEPDPYTNHLTAWLHARVDRVYYLTEVLEEGLGITDGFQLLAMAQKKQIEEIGHALIAELEKLADA